MHRLETVVLKLIQPTKSKADWLEDVAFRYTCAVQIGLDAAKRLKTSARTKIHHESYRTMRSACSLSSEQARMAISHCVAAVRSYYGMRKSKHFRRVSFPVAKSNQGIGLGIKAYKVVENDGRFVLRASTSIRGQYKWLPLAVPEKWHDKMQYVYGDAKLFKRGQHWFVMLPLRIPTTPTVRNGQTFVGVDLGVVRLATVSTPDGVTYFSGKAIRHQREQFATIRKRYQRAGRIDLVKRGKGRERRWMTHINHCISKQLVEIAKQHPSPVIVFENLTGIRKRSNKSKRFNRMLNSWAFHQLMAFTAYKAERENIPVIGVDPRGTSRTCPKCGHSTRANRPNQSKFRCVRCKHQDNADKVASGNIAVRGASLYEHGQLDTARLLNAVGLACP